MQQATTINLSDLRTAVTGRVGTQARTLSIFSSRRGTTMGLGVLTSYWKASTFAPRRWTESGTTPGRVPRHPLSKATSSVGRTGSPTVLMILKTQSGLASWRQMIFLRR